MEIYRKTWFARKNRALFFLSLYVFFFIWAFYLGPNILDIIVPDLLKNYQDILGPLMISLIDYFFALIFMIYLIYPLSNLFRRTNIGVKEKMLATPATAGDFFIGDYIGQLPFQLIGILFSGPIITSLLQQIIHLTILHYLMVYSMLFFLISFGLLIGTVIACKIENLMNQNPKSQDKGKALLLFMSIILIGFYYFLHFIFEYLIYNPEIKNLLLFYPSFWYSSILIFSIDPIIIYSSLIIDIWILILLIAIVPTVLFLLSYKNARKFYSLELRNEYVKQVEENKKFYRMIKKILPYKYQNAIIIKIKDFIRKKEDLVKIIYSYVLFLLISIILSISINDFNFQEEFNLAIDPTHFIVLVLAWSGSIIFGIFMSIHPVINSKGILINLIKTPNGIKRIILSYLYIIFALLFFIGLSFSILFLFLFKLDIFAAFLFFVYFLSMSFILILQGIGIQCFRSLFKEKNVDPIINIYFIITIQIISFLISFFILLPPSESPDEILDFILVVFFLSQTISSIIGLSLFTLGFRKLTRLV